MAKKKKRRYFGSLISFKNKRKDNNWSDNQLNPILCLYSKLPPIGGTKLSEDNVQGVSLLILLNYLLTSKLYTLNIPPLNMSKKSVSSVVTYFRNDTAISERV